MNGFNSESINGLNNIYADDIETNTFINQPYNYFTGIQSNIQTQINNLISTKTIITRVNTSLTSLLGSTINLSTLCQNMYFDSVNRFFKIYKYNPANINDTMITIDQPAGDMSINASMLSLTGVNINLFGDIIQFSLVVARRRYYAFRKH
jgi:hypothetical protein